MNKYSAYLVHIDFNGVAVYRIPVFQLAGFHSMFSTLPLATLLWFFLLIHKTAITAAVAWDTLTMFEATVCGRS